jgi:hypothetical protein
MSSSSLLGVMRPGGRFVVKGAGFEASVEDADKSVGELAQSGVVAAAAGSLPVVVGACAGRVSEGAEGLGHEGVDEPVVVNESGQGDLLLARRAGDRGGAGVVLASLGIGVADGVVAELCEHPGAEHQSQPRLGGDDLSGRVPSKIGLDLPLQGGDLSVEHGQDRDQRLDRGGIGTGHDLGLAEMLSTQRGLDGRCLVGDVPAAGVFQRGTDLWTRQPGGLGRGRGLGQQLQGVSSVQVLERDQRGGEIVPQRVPQRCV